MDPICGCKGARYCTLCETSERVAKLKRAHDRPPLENCETFLFCPNSSCKFSAHRIEPKNNYTLEELFEIQSRLHEEKIADDDSLPDSLSNCDKIILIENFIDEYEESNLVKTIDDRPWVLSQSGRRKQDYGPKVNFKQQKVKTDHYVGMPSYRCLTNKRFLKKFLCF